ncbi:MAG: SHOCT domain-containing protein [Chloroflexi bacterium]|nr:SHOCT domain-containing protein [Chloroflexota bacterium]
MLFPRPGNGEGRGAGQRWSVSPPSSPPGASESPLEILKQRYARGELTKAEYEEMRRDILSS